MPGGDAAAQQLLGGVHVSIDQSGHGNFAATVERFGSRETPGSFGGRADPLDATAVDRDGGVTSHGVGGIEAHHVAAGDQKVRRYWRCVGICQGAVPKAD